MIDNMVICITPAIPKVNDLYILDTVNYRSDNNRRWRKIVVHLSEKLPNKTQNTLTWVSADKLIELTSLDRFIFM
ncbi:MAG: hypothetical protein L3V56_00480 [Candidatus Magnetoovum sp. WYHC-5]|nr:hypothetical protein [Candidatus Magnetoovum sp. WYHC-5]